MSYKLIHELSSDNLAYQEHRNQLIASLEENKEDWSTNLGLALKDQNSDIHLSVYQAVQHPANTTTTFHVLWDHRDTEQKIDLSLEKNRENILLESLFEVIQLGSFQHHGQGILIRPMTATGFSGSDFSGVHLSRNKVIDAPPNSRFTYVLSHELTHRDAYRNKKFNEMAHPYAAREVRAFLGSFAITPDGALRAANHRNIHTDSGLSDFFEESRKGFLSAYFIFAHTLGELDPQFKQRLKTDPFFVIKDPALINESKEHFSTLRERLLKYTREESNAADLYQKGVVIASENSTQIHAPNPKLQTPSAYFIRSPQPIQPASKTVDT